MITQLLAAALPFDLSAEHLRHMHLGKSSALEWLYALGALVVAWLFFRSVHAIFEARLRKVAAKTTHVFDDVLLHVVQGTYWFFHASLALLIAGHFADFGRVEFYVHRLVVLLLVLQMGIWLQRAAVKASVIWSTKNEGSQNATLAAGFRFVARLCIWIIITLTLLAAAGVQISAMVAGLGVGGVAAALAVQGVLSDIFAGLSMYFDRPFDIGDAIAVDPLRGTVSRIGLRTTRLRSLDGEEIVIPNGDLVKARIKNFARLQERRVVFAFGLEYGMSPEEIEGIRDWLRAYLKAEAAVRFDRGHFKGFGPSSLDFEFVYYVLSAEYAVYMEAQERISLALYRVVAERGLSFAFTTQTVHHVMAPPAGVPGPVSAAPAPGAGAEAAPKLPRSAT